MANYKSIYTGAEIDSAIGKANTALQEHQELKTIKKVLLIQLVLMFKLVKKMLLVQLILFMMTLN